MTKKAEKAHALLSASGSHKWLHCTPSARLEENMQEQTSDYAEEGRVAHEIAELKLKKTYALLTQRNFTTKMKKLKEHALYREEMQRHTDTYYDYISKIMHSFTTQPYIAIEKRIDYSYYAPEGFGTADCVIIAENKIYIIDFKYGSGVPVSAHANSQMMLYALGAFMEYSFIYNIDEVKMVIVQPRLDSISEYVISMTELLLWGEDIKPLAQAAYNGEGECVPDDYCRFCKAAAVCRARANANLSLETDFKMMLPPVISNEEVAEILHRARNLASWAKKVEEYALAELLKGSEIPGWKAVPGRATRKFTDIDRAFQILKDSGVDEAMLYSREPITLTETEKLIGKAKFNELLGECVETPQGKPTIALLSDKREPITRITAAQDFAS